MIMRYRLRVVFQIGSTSNIPKRTTMRRSQFIIGEAFLLVGALLLALTPVLHHLHLAAVDHARTCSVAHSAKHAQCACCRIYAGNKHSPCGSADSKNGKKKGGKEHDPDTCPICQVLVALMKSAEFPVTLAWLPPFIDLHAERPVLFPPQPIPQSFHFASGHPRAPPIS